MENDANLPKPDRNENRETYAGFMGVTKNALIVVVVVLVLMAIFLV